MNGKSAVKVLSPQPNSSQSQHPSRSIHSPMHKQPDLKLLPPAPLQSFHTQDRNGKGSGCVQALTNCPSCTLSLKQGLELMRESGGPMEFGIFDFYKVFSKVFGEEEDGVGGLEWEGGMLSTTPN